VTASAPRDELEVKAAVADPAALRAALQRAGARLVFAGTMHDRRYDRGGELERRDEVVRLRVYRPAAGAAWGVLAWKGPVSARGAYRHRAELETRVADPDSLPPLLARLGLEVTLRIDRDIEQWELDGAVLRLEHYPDMDDLLEVEGEPAAIERAVAATGLPRATFVPESLPFFVAAFERRTGRRARLAHGS
jgi:adenylate cyclase class IV